MMVEVLQIIVSIACVVVAVVLVCHALRAQGDAHEVPRKPRAFEEDEPEPEPFESGFLEGLSDLELVMLIKGLGEHEEDAGYRRAAQLELRRRGKV